MENIQRFGLLTIDETSWKWQVVDSFWTRGGERLGFEHLGKKVAGQGPDAAGGAPPRAAGGQYAAEARPQGRSVGGDAERVAADPACVRHR